MTAPSAIGTTATARRRGVAFWVAIVGALVLLALVAGRPAEDGEPLDPRSTGPEGARGLVILLEALGAEVGVSDRVPGDGTMMQMDVSFILILFLSALSGMLLLALRETAAMGTLLAIHLGIIAAFFIMIPYGKLAHVVYRYAALVKNAVEQRRAAAADAAHGHGH